MPLSEPEHRPRAHGVVSVTQRTEEGTYIDPWANNEPAVLEVPTIGDLYDRDAGNIPRVGVVATVNWHLGLIGHGGAFEGGDRDLAALLDSSGNTYGNSADYEVPSLDGVMQLENFKVDLDSVRRRHRRKVAWARPPGPRDPERDTSVREFPGADAGAGHHRARLRKRRSPRPPLRRTSNSPMSPVTTGESPPSK